MDDLLKTEEAKEMMDLSKSLLSEFTSSEMVTSAVSKMKTTWNEKGEELTEKGKEFVEKGLDVAQKQREQNEKKNKKHKHHKHHKEESGATEKTVAVIDSVVENRQKIAEMGMKMLEKVQADDTGKKMIGKGLEYVKKIKEEGGIEGALKKGQAMFADEKQREELISKVKDTVFDYLLKYIPSIEVPVLKGEYKDIKYRISDIDLSGFKLNSNDVLVRFILNRGKLDGAKLRVGVRNLKLKMKKIHCKIDKRNFPKYKGKASVNCGTENAMFGLAFKIRVVDDKPQLEIQHPYLKLSELEITVKHNSMAGVLNTVLKMANGYLCSKIESVVAGLIIEKSNQLLTPVNNLAIQYWPMLNQMVDTSAIIKGKERVDKDGKVINRDLSKELTEVEVEFMDGPIGLDLYQSYPTEPAVCKVKRFNHGPRNAKLQAERSGLIKRHDYIIAINGVDVTTMEYDKIIEMLGEVVRPFDVVFGREIMDDDEGNSRSDYDSDSESSDSDRKSKKKSKKSKESSSSSSSSSSESESESDEKPKKKSKKSKKEESSSEFTESSESESEEEKPKKKAAKKESSSSSSSESETESEEEKPKKSKKEESSSEFTETSSESEEEKPKKKAAKKESSSSSSSSSESESSESEEEKPKKKSKKEESSSSSSSSSESEEEKPKKKSSKKSKKESSSSSSSSSESEEEKPKKKSSKKSKKVSSSSDSSSSD